MIASGQVNADAFRASRRQARHRSGRFRLLPALLTGGAPSIAVLVFAVLLAGCSRHNHSATPIVHSTPATSPTMSPTASAGVDSFEAGIARRDAASLLGRTPVPPGSARLRGDEPYALAKPGLNPMQVVTMVTEVAQWTYPGTAAAAVAYLKAHQPANYTIMAGKSYAEGGPPADVQVWEKIPTSVDQYEPTLVIAVAAVSDRTVIRADAQVGWGVAVPRVSTCGWPVWYSMLGLGLNRTGSCVGSFGPPVRNLTMKVGEILQAGVSGGAGPPSSSNSTVLTRTAYAGWLADFTATAPGRTALFPKSAGCAQLEDLRPGRPCGPVLTVTVINSGE